MAPIAQAKGTTYISFFFSFRFLFNNSYVGMLAVQFELIFGKIHVIQK
jgi:hypothetical protein